MRRALVTWLCSLSAVALLAGCGSSSSGSSNPTADALSYFPAGSPVIVRIETDPSSAAIQGMNGLLNRFPIVKLAENALLGKLDQYGVDYQSDIKPLLGNPAMIGTSSSSLTGSGLSAGVSGAFGAGNNVLIAWVTKDASKLASLLKKIPHIKSVGSHDGATLYQSGASSTLAVNGPTLLLGGSESIVNQALDRHAHASGFSQSSYARAVAGQPANSLFQVFGDVSGLLSQPSAAKARAVPWVAALRSYAVSMTASSTGIGFSFKLDTSGRQLSPSQLPFASGAGAPSFVGGAPIGLSIQNPSHIVQYVLSLLPVVDPAEASRVQAQIARVRKQTGIDLQSVLGQFTGDLILGSDGHTSLFRVQVADPAKIASTLSKIAGVKGGLSHSLGGGFYALKAGARPELVGLVGNQVVFGRATKSQLTAFAHATTVPAAGAQGSVAFRVSLASLIQRALAHSTLPPQIAQAVLGTVGDLTGWLSSTPAATTGSATIAIH